MNNEAITMTIEHNGRTFGYNFEDLTVEQVELALTVGEFRLHQKESEFPDSIDKLLRSRGAEYVSIMGSLLFVPYSNNLPQKYESRKVAEYEAWFKSLPWKHYSEIVRCINDFFTNIGMSGLVSTTKFYESKTSVIETILPILMKQNIAMNSSKLSPAVKDVGTRESLPLD